MVFKQRKIEQTLMAPETPSLIANEIKNFHFCFFEYFPYIRRHTLFRAPGSIGGVIALMFDDNLRGHSKL